MIWSCDCCSPRLVSVVMYSRYSSPSSKISCKLLIWWLSNLIVSHILVSWWLSNLIVNFILNC